ncbi:hypothetical protein BURKHO8Y_580015 [Burkholderia sp. 8Y]|nr:hypothetical protein BURKHO8Y_580015 [Burkholderia sp. 8Y]
MKTDVLLSSNCVSTTPASWSLPRIGAAPVDLRMQHKPARQGGSMEGGVQAESWGYRAVRVFDDRIRQDGGVLTRYASAGAALCRYPFCPCDGQRSERS